MLIRFSKCSIFVPMYKMPSKAKNYLLSFYFKWLPGWSSWMLCPGNTMDFALLLPWSSVMELVRKIVKWETVSEWNIFHLICRNHVIQSWHTFLICVHCFSIINSRLFFLPAGITRIIMHLTCQIFATSVNSKSNLNWENLSCHLNSFLLYFQQLAKIYYLNVTR